MVTVYVFANSFWNTGEGMTGGDKRILEILKRWDAETNLPFKCIVYAPKKFINILIKEGIRHISFKTTSTRSSEEKGIITAYIIHTFKALLLIPYFKSNCYFYSTSDFFTDTIPCVVGKLFNKKVKWISLIHHIIETYHTRPGKKVTNFISYYAQRFSLLLITLFSDKVLLVSPLVKEHMSTKKRLKGKMILVDNGVDVAYMNRISPYIIPNRQYDAIMLARLAPSKGIFDLPKIWAAVCSRNPNSKLGLIGGGSEEIVATLKKMFFDEGISSNVDILGYLDTESTYRYLKSSKLFLFTSREEGWGISIAEAMACGLPVIAFDLPVYKYIFPKGIILISGRDTQEMANQTLTLLQNSQLRESLGNEGQQYVLANYSWDIIAKKEKEIMLDHQD